MWMLQDWGAWGEAICESWEAMAEPGRASRGYVCVGASAVGGRRNWSDL